MQSNSTTGMLAKGVVLGTPRTYGDRRTEDVWRRTIINGNWEGVPRLLCCQLPLHLDFKFRVNPFSSRYNGNVSRNGPDLDTMVIGALGGLLRCRNPERPTLQLIQHGGLCRIVTASKHLVCDDDQSGFTLHVHQGEVLSTFDISRDVGLSFYVNRRSLKGDRRRAVQQAAEIGNHQQFRAPRDARIEITLAFAEGVTRNPLSADWLEAVIDGLGASRVGNERFFDGPPTSEFGYDDSVVYHLICAQVRGLPPEVGLHVFCSALGE